MSIRVLIVDDSALMRGILKEVFGLDTRFQVLGEAKNGQEGIDCNAQLDPDLIIMDINMPVMDGLSATKRIMETHPTSILIFSNEADSEHSFIALKTGAKDIMKKPELDSFNEQEFLDHFFLKLQTIARKKKGADLHKNQNSECCKKEKREVDVIVMGTSTGGPKAVHCLFQQMPADFNKPIVLVQHLESGFDAGYAKWLNSESPLHIRLAKDNDFPENGEVLVAPNDRHLVFKNKRLFLDNGPKVLNQKPSVDVLFHSAAKQFGHRVTAVLLTGMGSDGAKGCLAVKQLGGYTIVQDRSSSTIFGMPKAAIDLNAACAVLPLDKITQYIMELVNYRHG